MSKVSIEATLIFGRKILSGNQQMTLYIGKKKIYVHDFIPRPDFSFLISLREKLYENLGHCGKNEHTNTLRISVCFRAGRIKITWDDSV